MQRRDRWLIAFVFVATLGFANVSGAQVRLSLFASGFSLPGGFVQDPTDPSIHFVIERSGRIRVVQGNTVLAAEILDVASRISCCGQRGRRATHQSLVLRQLDQS
jgi:hypothetical protein